MKLRINSFRIYDPKKIADACTNVDVIIVTAGISEQSVLSVSEYHVFMKIKHLKDSILNQFLIQ